MAKTLRCRLGRHQYVTHALDHGMQPEPECADCGKYKRTKRFDPQIHHASSAGGGPATTLRHNYGAADAFHHDRR